MALNQRGELFAWGIAAPGTWSDPSATFAPIPEKVRNVPNFVNPDQVEFITPTIDSRGPVTRIVGAPRFAYTIQVSTDLLTWTTITNLPNQAGSSLWRLPALGSNYFFRVKPE